MQSITKHLNKGFKLFDIAANLTDEQFSHTKHHEQDRDQVVKRAVEVGCQYLLIAGGSIQEGKKAFQLCQRYKNAYCTIGVHPCRANQPFDQEKYGSVQQYFEILDKTAAEMSSKLVAIGQCGLDYDRLHYATKEQQLEVFPFHFEIAQKYKLPLYLHNRNTGDDFYDIVKQNRNKFSTGVVHSFTGTKEEIKKIVQLDLYIGLNGCSFKTEENLAALKEIPVDRIMLETDAPYCEIRPSHAGSKFVKSKLQSKNKWTQGYLFKGRNEPCKIIEVLEVVSQVIGVPEKELSQIAFKNAIKMLSKVRPFMTQMYDL